jgi:hypothetical protein
VIPVEQRQAQRVECLKAGQIVLKNGSEMRCIIRNLSLYGACLQVSSHFGVPVDIFLWILGEGVKRPCRVVWRSNRQLGVLFSKAASFTV